MLDIRLLRENPEAVERGLRDRGGAELVRETVARDAERSELSGDVPYETLLTAQHHCIVVQGRNVRCNLSCGDPPTARC